MTLTRRDCLILAPTSVLAGTLAATAANPASKEPFGYCFNTSTIRGQKVPLAEAIDLVAKAGYQGIEPWVSEIDAHVQAGGSLKELAKRAVDGGLSIVNAIGFAEWIVDDDARRRKGLNEAQRVMGLLRELGCRHLAAPPVGAIEQANLDLLRAAERYRALLELGDRMDVVPIVEVWGFSRTLRRLGETLLVAAEADHPKACVLPDVYHLRKGGSGFSGLRFLSPSSVGIFHVNDYPAEPGPDRLTDADRVYPGDGVAPWKTILRTLHASGYRGMLSLELFNRVYWKQDAAQVTATGLAKLKAVVRAAFS